MSEFFRDPEVGGWLLNELLYKYKYLHFALQHFCLDTCFFHNLQGSYVWDPVISTDAVEIEMTRVPEVTMQPE